MSPANLKAWVADSISWAETIFGGKANVIAGATNCDETTPHVHMLVIPIDAKGHLNCRCFLGGGGKLRQLQTSYAGAVAKHGLERGIAGSRRKYIPQKELHEWLNKVDKDCKTSISRLDQALAKLESTPKLEWAISKTKIVSELTQVLDESKNDLTYAFGLAQEVVLARRDALEREQIFREKRATEQNAVEVKQRADEVLKQNADLVRGLDLGPIASDILSLTPTLTDGVCTLADENIALKITGRKFQDTQNNACKGSGAIDLVMKLTGRNFKGAVEYLLTRYPPERIEADAAGNAHQRTTDVIHSPDTEKRILTLSEIPAHIHHAHPTAWPLLCNHLVENHHLDRNLLEKWQKQGLLWAKSDTVLAVARTDFHTNDPTPRGVTLLNLASPPRPPRVLVPHQGGVFWVGSGLAQADTLVAVANPLEALSYRQVFLLDNQDKDPTERTPPPLIMSIDAMFPSPMLIDQIKRTHKKFKLATNTPLRQGKLAEKLPFLLDADGQYFPWFSIEHSGTDWPTKESPLAWTQLLAERMRQTPLETKIRRR